MTIGDRIRARRMELGLSQLDLAKRMGLTAKSTICQLESQGDNVTTDRVKRVAEALGVTPSYIMGWDDDKEFVADAPEFDDIHIELIEVIGKLSKESVDSLSRYAKYLLDCENN